ncbi:MULTISPECIES: hypothetical protein [Pseudomonas]|uniref:hypothetical protein n=1 Tax=Pseudomonas TaxID=286 RepID=UPI00111BFC05|nr:MULTISPECIES: hypothetical protein [Pseudomonas]NKF28372.1 hypothetical protein [Pseudomonas sp. BG5]
MNTVTILGLLANVTDTEIGDKLREKCGIHSVASIERSGDGTRAKVVCVLPQPKQTQEKLMVEVSSRKNLLWEYLAR